MSKQLREKDDAALRAQLLKVRRQQLDLRMQEKMGVDTVKTHSYRVMRREIARIKTILRERATTSDK